MNNFLKIFLVGAFLYAGHNLLNGILYGFGMILVITFVPYLLVTVFWNKMHFIVKAIVLLILALVELPVLASNFHGWDVGTISGVLLLLSMLTMLLTAVMVVNDGIGKRAIQKKKSNEVKDL